MQKVWSQVLSVPADQVPTELCRLAGLVPEIIDIVHLCGDEHQISNVDYWAPHWAGALTGSSTSGANASNFIAPDMVRNLGMTASYLGLVAREGTVPNDEHIAALRDQVAALLDEARTTDKLPLDLQTVLVRRLHDIVYALDHVRIVGPAGVQAAVERLICGITFTEGAASSDANDSDGIAARAREAARAVYAAFLLGPTAYESIEGWSAIAHRMLGM